ncbi:hypothetical protein HDV06_002993 [Boothiomyces sp. JEL0866]|nr:hypothetical protein HDV06_000389 [Boothiomyces sp. JEL0866]KAJ3322449.1 hypothetical protein HDV06_002993 [Boothiomyces sp. JEL0866]
MLYIGWLDYENNTVWISTLCTYIVSVAFDTVSIAVFLLLYTRLPARFANLAIISTWCMLLSIAGLLLSFVTVNTPHECTLNRNTTYVIRYIGFFLFDILQIMKITAITSTDKSKRNYSIYLISVVRIVSYIYNAIYVSGTTLYNAHNGLGPCKTVFSNAMVYQEHLISVLFELVLFLNLAIYIYKTAKNNITIDFLKSIIDFEVYTFLVYLLAEILYLSVFVEFTSNNVALYNIFYFDLPTVLFLANALNIIAKRKKMSQSISTANPSSIQVFSSVENLKVYVGFFFFDLLQVTKIIAIISSVDSPQNYYLLYFILGVRFASYAYNAIFVTGIVLYNADNGLGPCQTVFSNGMIYQEHLVSVVFELVLFLHLAHYIYQHCENIATIDMIKSIADFELYTFGIYLIAEIIYVSIFAKFSASNVALYNIFYFDLPTSLFLANALNIIAKRKTFSVICQNSNLKKIQPISSLDHLESQVSKVVLMGLVFLTEFFAAFSDILLLRSIKTITGYSAGSSKKTTDLISTYATIWLFMLSDLVIKYLVINGYPVLFDGATTLAVVALRARANLEYGVVLKDVIQASRASTFEFRSSFANNQVKMEQTGIVTMANFEVNIDMWQTIDRHLKTAIILSSAMKIGLLLIAGIAAAPIPSQEKRDAIPLPSNTQRFYKRDLSRRGFKFTKRDPMVARRSAQWNS